MPILIASSPLPSPRSRGRECSRSHASQRISGLVKALIALAFALVTTFALARNQPVTDQRLTDTAPKAAELCTLLVGTLQAKRTSCCSQAGTANLLDLCDTTLKPIEPQLKVDAGAWQQCVRDLDTYTADCGFVQQQLPPLPASCRNLVQGNQAEGGRCQSSLSCQDGLYCLGLSVGQSGVCSKPVAVGARCESAHDNLAGILGLTDLPKHRSCQGRCERGFCLAAASEGEACQHRGQCHDALQCVAGTCQTATPAAPGAACDATHFCEFGSTCRDGRCQFRKPEGESCRIGFECAALACEKADGAELGVCAAVCPNAG